MAPDPRLPRPRPPTWLVATTLLLTAAARSAIEPERSFTWTTGSLGVQVTARHAVEPAGHGSRATLSLQFGGLLGGLVARLTRGLNNRYLGIEADGLKRRSEDDAWRVTRASA